MGKNRIYEEKKTITTTVNPRLYREFSERCSSLGYYRNEVFEALMKGFIKGLIEFEGTDKLTIK